MYKEVFEEKQQFGASWYQCVLLFLYLEIITFRWTLFRGLLSVRRKSGHLLSVSGKSAASL